MFEGFLFGIAAGFVPGIGGDLGDLGERAGGVGRLRMEEMGVCGLFRLVSIPRPIDMVEDEDLSPARSCAASTSLRVGSLMGDLAPFLGKGVGCCHTAAAPFTSFGGFTSLSGPRLGICPPVMGGSALLVGFCGSGDLTDLLASGGPTDSEGLRVFSITGANIGFCLSPGDVFSGPELDSLADVLIVGDCGLEFLIGVILVEGFRGDVA